MGETVVLLHGFGGTRCTWDGVIAGLERERYSAALALDLPGHGEAAGVRPIAFAGCVEQVLARAPASFTLCGYSLGGRVALHVALAAPERVRRLVLVSASPGIEDAGERAARREADERLAQELEGGDYERFIERWRTQPLFAEDPPAVAALAREEQGRNDPLALAAAMRGLGAGVMEPLWGRLGELAMPVALLAGERDEKYVALAHRMRALLAHASVTVLPGGHSLALENPAGVAAALVATAT